MKNPKSVALFLPSLQGGGAERFMVDLSNGLSEQGYRVSLVVGNLRGQYFSEISEKVEIVDLKSIRTLYCVPGLIRFLRRCKPDTLISTIYHANMVAILSALLSFTKTKIIVRDSNMHKTLKEASSSFFSYKLTFSVMRFLYNQSDAIVAVSQAMKDELRQLMPEVESKLHLIHNFIDIDQINILSEEPVDHPWLQEDFDVPIMLSAGRLSNQKNWPVLLRAFADVVARRDLRLIILGEGEKRNEIENLIEELGIQDKISMPGFKQNPFSWMAKAEIFALSSDAEGFPNVLVQALNCGCKVISSDCESGPREILEEGKWGYLTKVADIEDLSSKIEMSIDDSINTAAQSRAEFFSRNKCIELYENIINSEPSLIFQGELSTFQEDPSSDFIEIPEVISFFIPSLEGGGAERFILNLANEFSEKGSKVYLVLSSQTGSYISEVNNEVEMIDLRSSRVLYSLPRLVQFLRSTKPAFLISSIYHTNMVAILASIIARSKTKVIVREDNMNQSLKNKSTSYISYRLTLSLKKLLYKMSHAVVVLSTAMKEEIQVLIPGIEDKVSLIYNFVDLNQINFLSKEKVDHPWFQEGFTTPVILSAGRLSVQKNYPVLINAFSEVLKTRDLRLIILGEGEKRQEIEELIAKLGIQDKVSLPGFKQNPFSWMARAEIFALSSDFEGCPNVLLQALGCGCKVIASDSESGPREILERGKWGRLFKVGDVEDLSNKILSSLQQDKDIDPKERAKYFSNERCLGQYRELFAESK